MALGRLQLTRLKKDVLPPAMGPTRSTVGLPLALLPPLALTGLLSVADARPDPATARRMTAEKRSETVRSRAAQRTLLSMSSAMSGTGRSIVGSLWSICCYHASGPVPKRRRAIMILLTAWSLACNASRSSLNTYTHLHLHTHTRGDIDSTRCTPRACPSNASMAAANAPGTPLRVECTSSAS